MADEPVVVEKVRREKPYWSEGALLYLKSFFGGEAGKNDKGFHKFAGTKEKDIQQGEDRQAREVLGTVLSYLQGGSSVRSLSIGEGQRWGARNRWEGL